MNHGIEVHLSANIEKYKQGMESAKKIGSESMGNIAAIFEKIKSALGGMWDSFKSFFSNMDKTKGKMGEVDDKSTGLATKIGVSLVAAFVAATAAIGAFVKKGLEADAALAKMSISGDIGAANLSRFEAVALRSGMSITEFGGSMAKLHDEMKKAAAGDDAGIFDKLGVKIVDANNALLKTDDVTVEVAKKIAAMSSEAEKYDAAAKVGFSGKVQLLEDIAHASTLAASTTDDQAAATVRLGKIWHEILPGGKSMWAEISTFLAANLTPAMTEASLTILKARHEIVDAFNQIFGTASQFPKFGDQIKEWATDASKWFAKVAESSAAAQISIMKFIAEKTGIGDPSKYVKPDVVPGYVPGAVTLASGKNDPVITDAEKELRKQFDATNKTIADRIEIMKRQIQLGETLTEGQRALMQLDNTALKLSPEERAADLAKINSLIALEKQFKAGQDAKAAGAAATQKEAEAYARLIAAIGEKIAAAKAEASGLPALTEAQKLQVALNEQLASGKLKLTDVDKAEYAQKIKALAVELAVIESQKRAAQGAAEMVKIWQAQHDAAAKSIEDANKEADKNEELARTFGMTKSAIEAMQLARLEDQLAQRSSTGMTLDEIETLEKLIEAKRRSAGATATIEGLEEQKKVWESIESTAHDTWISIFDSGKSAFDRLKDTLKNGLLDLLYQMTLKKWIFNIGASVGMTGAAGAAQAASAAGGIGSAVGAAGNIYSAVSGGMTLSGGLGTSFMGSVSGGLMGAGAGSGLTSAAGLSVGEGIAGVVGPQVAGALSSGMSMLAAAAPYLAAAMAVYAVWKSLDTSGTYHTGGASSASAAGVHTVAAESLHFEATRTNSETEKMTAALASGIVNILDSTATAFGKTAGYTAATAFADDTSKDGAWGGLVISKLGDKILDWQDTKAGSWAPKVFADGDAGKAEYLAALSTSVRTALDGIGLPAWAETMLNKVGAGASIEDLGKVVDSINATQRALVIMGDKLAGFASLSDSAVSALIAASGGIDSLAASASSYYDNFYSDAEKMAGTTKQVGDALAAVGLAMPASREAFRTVLEAELALGEAGAPAVAALLKVSGSFAQLHPVIESTTGALASTNKGYQDQIDTILKSSMSATDVRAMEIKGMDASTIALYDRLAGLKAEAAATVLTNEIIQKARDTAIAQQAAAQAANQSFGNALVGSMNAAIAAAKALRAFNDSLLLGNLSPLSKGAQYDIAKRAYGANPSDQASATAFLQASQARGGSKLDYARDFAMVIAGNSAAATGKDNQAAAIPGLWRSLLDSGVIGAHANGGIASGWSLVGEQGPELAHFAQPARIYTAGQTRSMMDGNGNSELKSEISQLRTELNSALQAIALNTSSSARHAQRTSDVLQRVTRDGNSLLTSAA